MGKLTELIRALYTLGKANTRENAPPDAASMHPLPTGQDSDLAQFKQAREFHQQGFLNKAEAIYQALLLKHPGQFELLRQLGLVQGQRGNFMAAIVFFEQVIAVDPDNASIHGSLGNCFKGLGKLKEALSSYDRALALHANDADILYNRGATLSDLKLHEEALESYNQALAINPAHVLALENRGLVLTELLRHEEALVSFEQALTLHPDRPFLHYQRGNLFHILKRYEDALTSYTQALKLRPDFAEAFMNQGVTLRELHRPGPAIDSFDKAIECRPGHSVTHIYRGITLMDLNRPEEALTSFNRALELDPQNTTIYNHQGAALQSIGRHELALCSYEQVLQRKPNDMAALINHGVVLRALHRHANALDSFTKALAIEPDHAIAHYNRAIALGDLQRYNEALESCELALQSTPGFAEALHYRGNTLCSLYRHDEALASYDCAIEINPDYAAAHTGRGNTLFALERLEEAIASYDQAIRIRPDHADTHLNLSLYLLQLGKFERGWEEFEWRWQTEKYRAIRLAPDAPIWKGQNLQASLLVWNEHGVGDEIFYASMLNDLAQFARSITICVDPRLIPLFRRSFRDIQVVSRQMLAADAHFEAHTPIGSLGRYLRRNYSEFPATATPYLFACPARAQKLRNDTAQETRMLCGMSWVSRSLATGMDKSLRLLDLAPVLKLPGIDFVDLQYGDTSEEQTALFDTTGLSLKRVAEIDNLTDIDGLAALIEACDLIVTVSNTTAHLAGALGKPVLLMLPHAKGLLWYWHVTRPHMPWYPTIKIFRQPVDGDWQSVIEMVMNALSAAREDILGGTDSAGVDSHDRSGEMG